jgi:hypothetical protein
MPELDREIVARALRWCAESGRATSEAAVRAVLEPLRWDDLLAVRALLADPPPARGLGPEELLERARHPAGAAAPGGASDAAASAASPAPERTEPAPRRRGRGPARAARGPNIRRAADRAGEPPPPEPLRLPLDDLYREEGRAELERMVRRLGANRLALLAELGATWLHGDGTPAGADDLRDLLVHHRLARGFEERERALLLHQLRKAGGVRVRAARDLGWTVEDLDGAVRRLGLGGPVSALREARGRALLGKATLAERARLLDEEAEALEDLGLAGELEEDLRRRLPEHLRALGSGVTRGSSRAALARSLSLSREAVDRLAERLALGLPSGPQTRDDRPVRRERSDRPGRRDRPPRRDRPDRGDRPDRNARTRRGDRPGRPPRSDRRDGPDRRGPRSPAAGRRRPRPAP